MNRKVSLGVTVALILLAMAVTISATVMLSMRYFSGIVNGVQGRYFTPLLLGVVMALRGSWNKLEWKELTGILTALMGLLDVAVLFSVFLQVFG